MKGKLGIVVGLAAGYVLGTRAGRERYNQIKQQVLKAWNTDAVQKQVYKVQDFAQSTAGALPSAVWNGAVKVGEAVKGKGTAGEKLGAARDQAKRSAQDVAATVKSSADGATAAADEAFADTTKAARESDGN